MKVLPAIAVAALACLLVAAAPADLEAPAAPGRLSRVVGFFSLGSGVPDDVAAAIDDWEAERHEAALASLARAASTPGLERHRDEIHLVRGLVLDDLDWRDEAAAAYAGVLETSPPSPYHPLALLRLVESRRALGDRDAVIEAYRRHFAKPWAEKSVRAQAIRNVLEAYGDLRTPGDPTSAEERALLVSPTRLADLVREAKERPAERIAYLAGLELAAAGHLREAVDAFDRVGLSSPYHRFAA